MGGRLQRFFGSIILSVFLAGCAQSGADSGTVGTGLIAPAARDDRVVVLSSAEPPGAVVNLGVCSGFGFDSFGTPSGVVVSFGGGTSGIPATPAGQWGVVRDGDSELAAVSVSSDGFLSIVPEADSAGNFTLTYSISNDAGTSTATVVVAIEKAPRAPVPLNDNILIAEPVTAPFSGEYSLRGNDDVGAPGAPVVDFALVSPVVPAVGNLDNIVLEQAAPFAGGTIMVSTGGLLVYKDWTYPGVYTFSYTLANDEFPDGATAFVELKVPGPPVAVDDDVSCKNIGKSKTLSFNVVTGEDPATGLFATGAGPDATGYDLTNGSETAYITGYGGLDFGVLEGSVGESVPGPEGSHLTATITSEGLLTLTYTYHVGDPAPAGEFRLSYTLANSHGDSTAVVTFHL